MARKKKNPLGDFEDALNSLGFGGQEGGGSVTDIDNQDVVNQVLDDPNDDVKNLDNPDDNKPTEDNKNVDPNAKEDNSEVPDNILNNTSDNNKQDSEQDQQNTDLNQTDDQNQDENTEDDPGEAEQIGAFFDAFAEANGWSVDEDERPKNVDELVGYIKNVVETNSVPEYADERIEQLDQYVKNGGKFEDFYQTQQRTMSYDNIDIEDESNQKQVVRDYYKLQGMSDEQINRKIERYEDADMLEDEATDAVNYLKAYEEQQAQYMAQQQEAQRQAQEQQAMQFAQDLTNGINSLTNIRGINIPKEDKKALYDYITKTDADGLTAYQKEFNGNLVNNLIESAYFTMKGDALLGEANRNGQTSAANKLRNMLRHQTKNHSSYNVGTEKQPQIWDVASRYL